MTAALQGFRQVYRQAVPIANIVDMAKREHRVSGARKSGVSRGVASVVTFGQSTGRGRPTVRRATGSLREDARALKRDSDRLFGAGGGRS